MFEGLFQPTHLLVIFLVSPCLSSAPKSSLSWAKGSAKAFVGSNPRSERKKINPQQRCLLAMIGHERFIIAKSKQLQRKGKMAFAMRFLYLVPVVAVAVWPQDHLMSHVSTKDTSWVALTKNMETMHTAMAAVEPSGNEDADFVNLMLPHHQAAVDMARTELLYGNDPQMRRLAQEIITDQESEIQLMQIWLDRQRVHTTDPSQLQGSGSRRDK
jgi:uncharacterized protein (DUF305 family)